MPTSLDALSASKTVLLTTYKRDGTPIGTPVSIAFDGDRAFFRSYDKAWKTKRLRSNPQVEVAPCTMRGKPTGASIPAQARLLNTEEAQTASASLARQHPMLQRILVPFAHRLMRYQTLHYELVSGE